ncbi:GDSL-type esterase/lipase family protein [Pseudomonas putida]|uniref:GDSL-type esterase/lipase family protein n=1 Tax=Pseudomonas putida TaxID=303 RepID=UPI00235BDC16|nr:GDSL-type esterase/lipase family protein [Pseudomonas putida]GLO44151.1 hypothetical protein PPUN109347_07130 [Pseudomonas putida]HDS0979552.1 hypothetical protein [Pseudomonas putida]
MRYNTGNPVGPDGSSSPFDLHDNAGVLDLLLSGPLGEYLNRLGVPLKSWVGIMQQVTDYLIAQGYESVYLAYGAGVVVQRQTQLVQRSGELYRVRNAADIPLTLTGNWAVDETKLQAVGDAALRAALESDAGGVYVKHKVSGSGALKRAASERWEEDRRPTDFAKGDAVTNDSTAFAAFEAVVSGKPVNLFGKTYLVNSIPNKNAYYNGTWLVSGNRRIALLKKSFLGTGGRLHRYGGQLRDLREQLGSPFVQYCGIVFIGDSITWGSGATGNNNPEPRDGTLSDPRDFYATASYVNTFKRYLQSRYAPLSTPIITNHSFSSSGESTVEYQREVFMYPRYGEIAVTQDPGASLSTTDVVNTSVVGGGQLQLASGNAGVDFSHSITFTFTGNAFRLYFSCVEANSTYYELLVDGVSQGVFSMKAGAAASSGTVTDGQVGAYYDHSFGFVRGKTITIRTKRNGESGSRMARLNAVRILKRIVVKNQGINGSSARVYGPNNLSGTFDGTAVAPEDTFVFCQLGTNDRAIPGANQNPRGPNIFRRYLDATLDYLAADKKVVLMCAPPATDENPASYWLNMTDIRDTIIRCAKARTVDFIDNYSVFSDVDMPSVTVDGLHPSDLGYAVMAANIVNALENA